MEMENEKKLPHMCGGVLSTILLSYRKEKSRTGTSDPLNQNIFLMELARVVNPGMAAPPEKSLKAVASVYVNCRKETSEVLPFKQTPFIESFKKQMKEAYPVLLFRMDRLLASFIDCSDPNVREPLVREIYEIIGRDPACRKSPLLILPEGGATSVSQIREIDFQSFILGIWFYIVSSGVSNRVKKDLFDAWKEGKRGRYRLPGKVMLQKVPCPDTAETTPPVMAFHEEEPGIPGAPRPDGVSAYLKRLAEKYNRIPTILCREPLTPFRDYYVPNDVEWQEPVPGERFRFDRHRMKDVTVSGLLAVSSFLVLSGTGGLGKSMMMRNLLLSAVDSFEDLNRIPFFIPLRDYKPGSSSLLEDVFATVSPLWPEMTPPDLDALLAQGKALLLLDGLDEIHSSVLTDFTRKMNAFRDRYAKNAFIISSRPYSNFLSFTRATVLDLQPFRKEQALELVDRYNYRSDAPTLQARFRAELDHELFSSHKGFSDNPLLLSIMMLTFEMDAEIPPVKYLFYQEAYTVLSRRHDALKDGFSRKLETGWNANRFADCLAFFCAISYADGVVSFTMPEMEKYFRAVTRKYHWPEVTVDSFIADLTNNLCLMYLDGSRYSFIHRSFQEYFCARYFNAQLDELLTHAIPVFDRDDLTKKGDSALEMLFDMKPKAVEKYLIVPYLRKLLEDCESRQGIWTFLDRLYNRYEMADGDADIDDDNCKPHSNLYSFILDHYQIPLMTPIPDDFPGIDCFTEETWVYREDLRQNDLKRNLPHDYEAYYAEPEETGHLYVIPWSEVQERVKRFPERLEGFIPAVENPENAFMAEYNAIRKLLSELEEKNAAKPAAANIFDLME